MPSGAVRVSVNGEPADPDVPLILATPKAAAMAKRPAAIGIAAAPDDRATLTAATPNATPRRDQGRPILRAWCQVGNP